MIATTVDIVSPAGLSEDQRAAWRRLRWTRGEYATPFFSLAFTEAVEWSRGDVRVAVLSRGGQPIGFFPFHRVNGVAVPVGRYFNDAHNVIASPETTVDWLELLERCDVKAFDFHALVAADPRNPLERGFGTVQSFSARLGDDSAAFLDQLGQQHRTIRRQSQKSRKLSREVGKITLEFDCRDDALLAQTIQWKRNQYRRTHILDLFSPDWTRRLMQRLHEVPPGGAPPGGAPQEGGAPGGVRGLLSVLRAGDQIVAAHYGLLESEMLHYWFPCYDPAFAIYSPGTALFTEMVREASHYGLRFIDMGYGEQPYKRKQTDVTTTVTFGCISRSSFYRQRRLLEHHTVMALKKIPLKEPLKKVMRMLRPHAGIGKID